MSYIAPILPDSAPFPPAQRAWLDGWLAAALGSDLAPMSTGTSPAVAAPATAPVAEVVEDFPWHDESLPLEERLRLAEGRKRERVWMAAMAQVGCGQCRYLVQTYAAATASGAETSLPPCV